MFKVPFTAPVLGLALASSASQETGLLRFPPAEDGKITVHDYQAIQRFHALPCDRQLGIIMHLATQQKPSDPFGFSADICRPDQSVICKFQTRLRTLDTADFKRMRGTGLPRNIAATELQTVTSAVIDAGLVANYIALGGDDNPLHVDDIYAQAYGLERAIVPGMLLVGALETVVDHLLPEHRVDEVRVRFLAPVLVGTRVRFGLQMKSPDGQNTERARIFALTQGDIVAAIADVFLSRP
ncbi:MAG: MaoC family dehydratase [Rhodobacterales bacterium]|nr:MaoC family dehydratase [Rhodobacterales bacterium]